MDTTETPSIAQDLKAGSGPGPGDRSLDNRESGSRNFVDAAAQMDPSTAPPEPVAPELFLPDELKPVLRLEPRLRSCFLLRNLAGLPPRVCARLLRSLPDELPKCAQTRVANTALVISGGSLGKRSCINGRSECLRTSGCY
jgi:hypothetical protein